MCHPKPCRTCGKTTWGGCGLHVEAVRMQVPTDQWCAGHSETRAQGGLMSRLRGRGEAR